MFNNNISFTKVLVAMRLCHFSFVFLSCFLSFVNCVIMKGYTFDDNKMNVRMGPDDGYLRAEMLGFVPTAITVCMRFYPNYKRHGDQLGLWHIHIPHDERWPIFNLYCQGQGRCGSEFHGYIIEEEENAFPRVNLIRKWSSLCVGLDFINDEITAFFNGMEVIRTKLENERKESGNPLEKVFPSGNFSGNLNYKKTNMYCHSPTQPQHELGLTL